MGLSVSKAWDDHQKEVAPSLDYSSMIDNHHLHSSSVQSGMMDVLVCMCTSSCSSSSFSCSPFCFHRHHHHHQHHPPSYIYPSTTTPRAHRHGCRVYTALAKAHSCHCEAYPAPPRKRAKGCTTPSGPCRDRPAKTIPWTLLVEARAKHNSKAPCAASERHTSRGGVRPYMRTREHSVWKAALDQEEKLHLQQKH